MMHIQKIEVIIITDVITCMLDCITCHYFLNCLIVAAVEVAVEVEEGEEFQQAGRRWDLCQINSDCQSLNTMQVYSDTSRSDDSSSYYYYYYYSIIRVITLMSLYFFLKSPLYPESLLIISFNNCCIIIS